MIDIVIGNSEFSRELSKGLGAKHIDVQEITYLDNEIKPTILIDSSNQIQNKNVLVCLYRSRFEADTNDYLIKLYFIVNILRKLKPKDIQLVIQYLNYTRQQKAYLVGEPISIESILNLFKDVTKIFTLNSHLFGRQDLNQFTKSKIFDIDCTETIANYFNKFIDMPFIIGPDKGSENMVKKMAEYLECDYFCLDKTRDKKTSQITINPKINLNLENKDVIIYDDLTATGNTIKTAYEVIEKLNPRTVYIAVIHLWGKESIQKLTQINNIKNIVTTNSFNDGKKLDNKIIELSIVNILINQIREQNR